MNATMRCSNCHRRLHTTHLGVSVCLHCWHIGRLATRTTLKRPSRLRQNFDKLLTRAQDYLHWVLAQNSRAYTALMIITILLLSVIAGQLWTDQRTSSTAAKTVATTKPIVSKPTAPVITKPTTALVTDPPANTSTPVPVPTPVVTPKPAPVVVPPVPSYIISNALCTIDATQAHDQLSRAQDMVNVCQIVYPQIEARLSPSPCPAPHHIVLDYNQYAAYAQNCIVHVSIDWLRNSPYDPGLIPHELAHTVQGYGAIAPGWITEGLATYISYKLQYSIGIAHCNSDENYLSGYGCGASLFNYIERVYKPSIVKDVHNSIKANTYTDAIFQTETGKPLATLYTECRLHECAGGKP